MVFIPEQIINRALYSFLYSLLKRIFLRENIVNVNVNGRIRIWMNRINQELIKNEEKYITQEFNIRNMENILDFIKSQNKVFAGDIFEGILIKIFSRTIIADRDETFWKYIYNNLPEKNIQNLKNLINIGRFREVIGIHNIENLLALEKKGTNFGQKKLILEEENNNPLEEENKEALKIIYGLLLKIDEVKYSLDMKIKKGLNYLIYESFSGNSITNNNSNKKNFLFLRNFFFSVFIYYQNKKSPLMNYIQPQNNKIEEINNAYIPFSYDLRGAKIVRNAFIIFPIKIEPRITNILLDNNDLQEIGMLELRKVLIFNKGIKYLSNNNSSLKSSHLEYFSNLYDKYDNYTLEELHLSDNFLTENCEEYLSKLLPHLRGLKTLNLSFNNLKSGLASSFIVLRKLYRKGNSKLENLYLNECAMSEDSFYELGELLKSKFCKLKLLCLNNNSFINISDFLKKIKKNKSLKKLYLNQNSIGNNDINDILRIINLTNITTLYLYKTKITDFNKFLTILYRTKIIEEKRDDLKIILDEGSNLFNLDLSSNEFNNINKNYIYLLSKIIKETSLKCLDISNILYEKDKSIKYEKKIKELINMLEHDKKEYNKYMIEIRKNKVDIERYKNEDNENSFRKYDDDFNKIIKDERAKYDLFLIKMANNKKKEIFELRKIQDIGDNLVNYLKYLRAKHQAEENEEKFKEKKIILV